jgi:hypothetical protein
LNQSRAIPFYLFVFKCSVILGVALKKSEPPVAELRKLQLVLAIDGPKALALGLIELQGVGE